MSTRLTPPRPLNINEINNVMVLAGEKRQVLQKNRCAARHREYNPPPVADAERQTRR